MRIPAPGYHHNTQGFYFNFFLAIFSGVLPQVKELFQNIESKVTMFVTVKK
jgi:hypothetical protein